MYKRVMTILISFLSCCAMICVGFSAWTFNLGQDLQAESNGVIQSEDVIVSDDYVKISDEDMTKFVVTENGFNNGSYSGSFTVAFSVNAGNCRGFAGTTSKTLTVRVTLSFADNSSCSSLFQSGCITCSSSNKILQKPSVTESEYESDSSSFTAKFTLDVDSLSDNTDDNSGILTFEFKFQTKTTYTQMYSALKVTSGVIGNPFKLVVAVSNEPNEGN